MCLVTCKIVRMLSFIAHTKFLLLIFIDAAIIVSFLTFLAKFSGSFGLVRTSLWVLYLFYLIILLFP